MTLKERFWKKVNLEGPLILETPCWEWVGYRTKGRSTYGRIWDGERVREAHRVGYELQIGEVPEGLVIDHLCRNHGCIRGSHLEAVTRSVNALRGDVPRVSRLNQTSKTHCPRDHPYSGENLIIDEKGRRRCRTCRNSQEAERRLKHQQRK